MTATDVQALLTRQRAFDRAIDPAGLTAEQRAFVEETYQAVNPPDPGAWASGFLKTMGIGNKNANPQPQQQQAQAAAQIAHQAPTTNISDRGPASAGDIRDVETLSQTRPLEMTGGDFERLELKVGREKALALHQASVNRFLRGIKLTPERRR
jgi:hypothetical protein